MSWGKWLEAGAEDLVKIRNRVDCQEHEPQQKIKKHAMQENMQTRPRNMTPTCIKTFQLELCHNRHGLLRIHDHKGVLTLEQVAKRKTCKHANMQTWTESINEGEQDTILEAMVFQGILYSLLSERTMQLTQALARGIPLANPHRIFRHASGFWAKKHIKSHERSNHVDIILTISCKQNHAINITQAKSCNQNHDIKIMQAKTCNQDQQNNATINIRNQNHASNIMLPKSCNQQPENVIQNHTSQWINESAVKIMQTKTCDQDHASHIIIKIIKAKTCKQKTRNENHESKIMQTQSYSWCNSLYQQNETTKSQ